MTLSEFIRQHQGEDITVTDGWFTHLAWKAPRYQGLEVISSDGASATVRRKDREEADHREYLERTEAQIRDIIPEEAEIIKKPSIGSNRWYIYFEGHTYRLNAGGTDKDISDQWNFPVNRTREGRVINF